MISNILQFALAYPGYTIRLCIIYAYQFLKNHNILLYLSINMSSDHSNTQCSSCNRTKMKFDVFTTKCTEHSYILCTPCARKMRGEECPECKQQRGSNKNGTHSQSGQKNGNGKVGANGGLNEDDRELKKLMKELLLTQQQNKLLLKQKSSAERQRDQKAIELSNIQLQIYKAKEQSNVKLEQLKAEHDKQINKLKEQFENESNAANKKTADQYQQKIDKLTNEKQEIRKNLEQQKQQMNKNFQLQKTLIQSNFNNEKQALIIDMQNKKTQAAQAAQQRIKETTRTLQQEIQFFKFKYENELSQLKAKTQKEKQQLINSNKNQQEKLKNNFAQEKQQLQEQFDSEKETLIFTYQRQHGEMRGSFLIEKSTLEEELQKKNQELQIIISRMNQQKKTLRDQHQTRQTQLHNKLQQYQSIMDAQKQQLQKYTGENQKLSHYVQSHGESLQYYNKQLSELEQYISRNNNHIVAQFKSLDETYAEPTPQKLKQVQLLVRQYKTVVQGTHHPLVKKIIAQKEPIVTNYIVEFMKNFQLHLQEVEVNDIFHLDSERGKKLKRIIDKIDLVRTLQNQNINDSIEMYFFPKLFIKFRQLLAKFNEQITTYNKQISEFQLIKQINHYYTFTDYLNAQFPQHKQACLPQYKTLDQTISNAFDRFAASYNQIKQDKPAQKLEDYLSNAEKLKRFIQILHHGKEYKKYTFYLQQHLGMKIQQIKWQILNTLNNNKKGLRAKLQSLMQSRVYFDCFLYQKIFKKLKVFDQILTKEENSYHNFNFTELYNKILNFLKILKEEKLNLVDVIVTDNKITIDDLQREYASIAFDQSVKNRYLYKIKNVLQTRSTLLSKINGNSLITNKELQQFEFFLIQALQLKNIKQINELPQLNDQLKLFNDKITILLTYFEQCFGTYYSNSLQFKELQQTNRNIKHYNQFQAFAQEYFPPQHQLFKKKVLTTKHYRLPKPQAQDQCVFNLLLRFNTQRSQMLSQIIATPEQPLKEQHFDFYTNMVKYSPKVDGGKLQSKLYKSIEQSIAQLQAKEWSQGEVSSPVERKLMQKLNKLQNKQIAYYRELISIHKNKVMDQRQKMINNEKRKLKEDDFQNLQVFLEECKKQQKNNKFYKLYINILDEHMNYSYENLSDDTDKKSHFLRQLYKINLSKTTPNIRDIFKSKEYKIYFCRPELLSIRSNITVIQKFQGENQAAVQKACEILLSIFKLFSIFVQNDDKSLLDDRERQRLYQQIDTIKHQIIENYLRLCSNIQYKRIFEQGCNRKRLFLQLIKIEMYSRLMRKIHQLNPFEDYFKTRNKYEQIVKQINIKIQRIYEQIKQFRFYKDEFKLQYDNRNFLYQHLKKVEHIVQVFKDIKYKLYKFEHYLKSNYLEELNLKQVNHKDVVQVVEMAWIKEYSMIKKEISEMLHNSKMETGLKYKMILHEQQIVRNENLLSCSQIIKEEYDFKKIVIEELKQIEQHLDKNVHELEKEYDNFTLTIKKMEEKKKLHVQTERSRIRLKYERLIHQAKDSNQQMENQMDRQQKIDLQAKTLNNQWKAEDQDLLRTEAAKIQYLRNKFNTKSDKSIHKIFQHFATLKKVQANFDSEIEELCRQIFSKIQIEIDKYDKNLKATFLNYIKKSKNNDFIMGANSMNIFKQVNEEQFHQNTKAMNDIHKILSKCPQTANNDALTKKLVIAFEEYQNELQRVEKEYYQTKSQTRVLQLIKQTKSEAKQLTPSVIIARIFAVYAIYRNIDSHQQEINFDGNPHAAQVVAILLLVDAQNKEYAKLDNKLIEVKTGQGKSRVLGGLNCYLALRGYEVYCGCYSSYLSRRDQEQFKSLFSHFGVSNNITYGAFSQHCQSLFNQTNKHNFKEVTKKVLLNEKLTGMQLEYLQRLNRLLRHEGENNRILVIDEVDVFFDEKYFGQLYTPGVAVDSPQVKILMRFIWEHRNEEQLNRMTFQSEGYINLLNLYPHLKELLKNQVESMLHACKNYNIHPYEIRNHQIQYVDNDSVNQKLNFGYSTAFASFYQYERGKISEENYNKNTNMSLIIGQFSYAQLPKYFSNIMGVSGTVEAMSEFRKKIMRQDYKISEIYCLPSIYGESRREMIPPKVCQPLDFIKHLINRIREVRKEQRPILVFFQTEEKLNLVANSTQFNQFTTNIYKITQKMPPQMRNPLINYAGARNRITLISSAFSRGTDFTVFDNDINEKGGMHVIQTYISKNYSDFIQISGRTARQGKNGSFQMIITTQDLNKNQIPLVEGMQLLEIIQKSWEVNDVKYGQELEKSIEKAYEEHKVTFQVVGSLTKENSKLVDAVKRLNYNEIKSQTIRTVIAIDGTGSMGAALNAVFSILNDTISRTQQIISMRMPNVSFEHKIMIYRNYNIKPMDRVLQQSNFSKNSKYLEDFMSCIKPEGGLGNEAHQILFYQIGKIYQIQSIDQVIIIGDAPANKYEEMVKHRKKFHGEALWSTKYPLLPSIEAYSEVAVKQKIPIHSFYILRRKDDPEAINWDNNVMAYFAGLSQKSQGLSGELNIRDQNEAKKQLTDFISERVLQLVGGKDLVEIYMQMYSKRYV